MNFNNLNKILSNIGHKYPNLLIFENTFVNGVPSVSIRFFYKKTREQQLIDEIDKLLYSEKALWNTKVYLYDPKIQLFRITDNVLIFKSSHEDLVNIVSDIKKCVFGFNSTLKWKKRLIHEISTNSNTESEKPADPMPMPTHNIANGPQLMPPFRVGGVTEFKVGNGTHTITCGFETVSYSLFDVDVNKITLREILDYYQTDNIINYIKTVYNGYASVRVQALYNDYVIAKHSFEIGNLNNPRALTKYEFIEKIGKIGKIGNAAPESYNKIHIAIQRQVN